MTVFRIHIDVRCEALDDDDNDAEVLFETSNLVALSDLVGCEDLMIGRAFTEIQLATMRQLRAEIETLKALRDHGKS